MLKSLPFIKFNKEIIHFHETLVYETHTVKMTVPEVNGVLCKCHV